MQLHQGKLLKILTLAGTLATTGCLDGNDDQTGSSFFGNRGSITRAIGDGSGGATDSGSIYVSGNSNDSAGSSGGGTSGGSSGPGALPEDGNVPPRITGRPPQAVKQGELFVFEPEADDPDGDPLSFFIEGKPTWAEFDTRTGVLAGTPTEKDVGIYGGVVITVSDGITSDALPPFDIEVTMNADGSFSVTLIAPTENEDGSTLTDLAGFRLYYGVREGEFTEIIDIDNPGVSTYVVDNLSPNTYYVMATAYNGAGIESDFSNTVTRIVN